MTRKQPFSFIKRVQSFKHALNGLRLIWQAEHNFRVHLIILLLTCITGFIMKISNLEWISIAIVSSIVLVTELLNTSIERISDFITKEKNPTIKLIKDIAAAAVLIAALSAIIVGLIIFGPYLKALI